MIVPNVMVPSIQASTQHQVEAVAGVPTETSVIARIPYRAVPATVAQRALESDMRNRVSYDHVGHGATSEVEQEVSGSAAGRAATGFSTPFMTQWLSQASANDNRLIASWLRVSRTGITPELMEEYAQVKYRPSNAGKPQPAPKGMVAMLETASQHEMALASSSIEVTAANGTPMLFEQMAEAPAEQLQFMLGQELGTPAKPRVTQTQTTNSNAWVEGSESAESEVRQAPAPQIRYNTSLIRDRGFDAYIATFSRNMLSADQGVYEPFKLTA